MKPYFSTISSLCCQFKRIKMETKTSAHETSSSSILLTGCIFLANLDFTGLLDYAVKAAIGGAIWLGYKLTADYIERKRNKQQ
jgi:hypothetical protein